MKTQARILEKYMHTAAVGRVEWIGLRSARKQAVQAVAQCMALAGAGLEGDHKALKASGSSRQVSVINTEDISAIQALLKCGQIDPAALRRNIVISGLNLYAMRYQRLRIGEAVIEVRAHCHPCVRMEQTLGKGALLAMYGHAGFCATVEQSGPIKLGDTVERIGQQGLL